MIIKLSEIYEATLLGDLSFKDQFTSGVRFITAPGCSGHFDWLRKGGNIVGVRFWPFSDSNTDVLLLVRSKVVNSRTLLFEDDKWVSFGFGEGWRDFVDEESQDQEIGDCGLLNYPDGSIGFYCSADSLLEPDGIVSLTC